MHTAGALLSDARSDAEPAAAPVAAAHPAPRAESLPTLSTMAVVGGTSDADYLRSRFLTVPVAGADMTTGRGSFSDPRDGERIHRAIDILAPRGTPILSADDGKILRMTTSSLGGITMYTVDPRTGSCTTTRNGSLQRAMSAGRTSRG